MCLVIACITFFFNLATHAQLPSNVRQSFYPLTRAYSTSFDHNPSLLTGSCTSPPPPCFQLLSPRICPLFGLQRTQESISSKRIPLSTNLSDILEHPPKSLTSLNNNASCQPAFYCHQILLLLWEVFLKMGSSLYFLIIGVSNFKLLSKKISFYSIKEFETSLDVYFSPRTDLNY